ncbi:MAG: hypothetical protein L6R40_004756 [Gallowayella cf. fulva]|nr:MAG: hypothetical protein L6R40_004756 [Xanthomendoza cf. fulva]
MLFTNTLFLALAATVTALPNALPPTKRSAAAAPAYSFPSFPGFGGGSGDGSRTANDVTNKAACKAITVIFARGTGESGNIGYVVGPPLLQALQSKLGADKVAYQGVPYAASAAGNANGGGNGGQLMASLAQQAVQQCPSTKVILSGYSQGGSVVHKAGPLLASTPIAAAVIFGDPSNGQAVTNVKNLKEYCAQGDNVCGTPRTYTITAAHGSYRTNGNAADAANYISSVTGIA